MGQIIDGGSTGSRLHIFEFVTTPPPPLPHGGDESSRRRSSSSSRTASDTVVERRGSVRTESPLSAFAPHHSCVIGSNDEENDAGSGDATTATTVPGTTTCVNATDLSLHHVWPMLDYAFQRLPAKHHATTPVHYAATAGMRLLTLEQQTAVYDAVYTSMRQHYASTTNNNTTTATAPASATRTTTTAGFDIQRNAIFTLHGDLEGYYGAVAANYLHGKIHANLTPVTDTTTTTKTTTGSSSSSSSSTQDVVGALDMGGSSTQIVFYTRADNDDDEDEACCAFSTVASSANSSFTLEQSSYCEWNRSVSSSSSSSTKQKLQLQSEHFFSTSYLSYGVDQFRERLWNLLVREHQERMETAQQCSGEQEENDPVCDSVLVFIANPCSNPGYQQEWLGYTLTGTGNTDLCTRYVQRLIPHPVDILDHKDDDDDVDDDNNDDEGIATRSNNSSSKVVGGVEHPPVGRNRFLAMSLYFFTLDALRVLTNDEALNAAWPTPTLSELSQALPKLCSMDWVTQLSHQTETHEYTRPQVLPHRCLEAVYMVTLLRDGFGFDDAARDITFAYTVADSEVEWTLGMALQLHASALSAEQTCTWAVPNGDNDNNNHNSDCEAGVANKDKAVVQGDDELYGGDVASDPETKNFTVHVAEPRKRRTWVQLVAKVLVSDGELFSTMSR